MSQPGYFFDSPSKYVSLKQYKLRNNVTSNIPKVQRSYMDPGIKYGKMMMSGEDLKIKEWFEKLTL